MRIVCISDTHGLHHPDPPPGDILIHAGDLSMEGTPGEVASEIKWIGTYLRPRYDAVVLVAGNHDFFAEDYPEMVQAYARHHDLVYLQDTDFSHKGVKFWGSPYTPEFAGWAFMEYRGPDIQTHWNKIPHDTDVLVTHGPPQGVLDFATFGGYVGCADLRDRVREVEPTLHVFGHIHEGYGEDELPGRRTRFINASLVDEHYKNEGREAIVYDLSD